QVGRILATLAGRGITNTIIVYTADHGDFTGQHGLVGRHPSLVYDSLIRVPLIVSGLAGQRQGVTDESAVTLADVMPTALQAAGAAIPAGCDGASLYGCLTGATGSVRDVAVVEAAGPTLAARSRRAKLVDGPGAAQKMFYRLDSDPDETDNQYGQAAGPEHAALAAAIARHRKR